MAPLNGMTEQEEKDLAALKTKQQELKNACYSYMASLDEATPDQLKNSGYGGKSNAEAMQDGFKRYQKQINELIRKHVQKYPD